MRGFRSALRLLVMALAAFFLAPSAQAAGPTCHGKFVNPITDVCWSCLFPLSVGGLKIWPSGRPDTSNPASPICFCGSPLPRIGISVGFWEPVRLADVTMKPWCFPNLGGVRIAPGFDIGQGYLAGPSMVGGRSQSTAKWHVHWYVYPLLYWMEILTDFVCFEQASFDIAYMTEVDPLWQDDSLTALINPEAVVFANPIAQSAKFGAFDQSFSEYIMTLVGTVVTTPSTDPSVGGKVVMFGPAEDAVVTALLDGTADAPPVKMLKCNDENCYDVGEQTLSVPASSALRPRIATMIKSMSDKIRSDTPLNAAEKQLLNLATVPIYKILAVQAYAHYALTDGEIQTLSEIVAVDLLSAMLDNMLDRVEQAKVHYQTFDQETATQWKQQIAATRAKFSQRDVRLNNKLQVTMQIINRSIMLESTLQNSMTPGMASALNFSRGLNAQGLN